MTASAGEMLDVVAARRKLMGNVVRTASCWTWRQSTKGEPRLRLAGREIAATHAIWFVVHREWPPSTRYQPLAHLCGNSLCLRPQHLGLVSVPEYMRLRFARSSRGRARAGYVAGLFMSAGAGIGKAGDSSVHARATRRLVQAQAWPSPQSTLLATPAERTRLRPSQSTGTNFGRPSQTTRVGRP
jgi:hypothetical protein